MRWRKVGNCVVASFAAKTRVDLTRVKYAQSVDEAQYFVKEDALKESSTDTLRAGHEQSLASDSHVAGSLKCT